MAAVAAPQPRPGGPGSAPPLREVSDQEVRDNKALVHHVLNRMGRRQQLTSHVEFEELIQIGMWGLWEGLRRWQPSKGARSTYCSSYIWGYVMKHQRDMTKANGWHRREGQIAIIGSYEAELCDDIAIRDTLAAPDDTAEQAEHRATISRLHDRADRLPPRSRRIAQALLTDAPPAGEAMAEQLGVSTQRTGQMAHTVRTMLFAGDAPQTGTLLVDRTLHPTEPDARREALRIHPGCTIHTITKRKVRDGKVRACQGRPAADGSLGRPVWAIELITA